MTAALAQAADSLARAAAEATAATDAGRAAPSAFTALGMHGAGVARAEAVMRAMEGWHEFYLLAGTAAVTLMGLLFVALSFHLDTLLHESRAHLLGAARLTFSNFIYVLTLSLMFLIPKASPRFVALWVVFASVLFLGMSIWGSIRDRGKADPGGHDRFMGRRRRMSIVGFLLSLGNAILLYRAPDPAWLYNFVVSVCLLLGNGAGTSWDLLVQVGRLRREQERAERAKAAS